MGEDRQESWTSKTPSPLSLCSHTSIMFQRKVKIRYLAFGMEDLDHKTVEQNVSLIQLTHITDEGNEAPAKTLGCLKRKAPFQ